MLTAVNAFAGIPSIQNCPTILLAEDNEDHVLFIKRAFIHARLLNPVKVVRDGREAVAYLKGEGKFADRKEYPGPALLLLDLKMPNMDGFEVMEWIRTQPTLARLRIVVLTTSDQIFDVNRAYALGAFSSSPSRWTCAISSNSGPSSKAAGPGPPMMKMKTVSRASL